MISGCNFVVPIQLDALSYIVRIQVEPNGELIVDVLIYWYGLLIWKEALDVSAFCCNFEPRKTADFRDACTLYRISHEDLSKKLAAVRTEKLGCREFASQNLLVQVGCLGVLERQKSANHCVENNSTRPEIAFETKVAFSSNHFRRGIARRTARRPQSAVGWLIEVAEAKINDLERVVVVDQEVFRLEVSVAYSTLV